MTENTPNTFGPKRGHPLQIFDRFFKDFGLLIIYIIFGLITSSWQILLDNIFLAVIVLIAPIGRLIDYLCTFYIITERELIIKTGLFKKSETKMPLEKINTVDYTQNLLYRLFGVYKLNIDNASKSDLDMKLVLKKKEAVFVQGLLLGKRTLLNREPVEIEPDEYGYLDANPRESDADEDFDSEKFFEPGKWQNNAAHENTATTFHVGPKSFFIKGLLQNKVTYIISFGAAVLALFGFVGNYVIEIFVDEPAFNVWAENFFNGFTLGPLFYLKITAIALVVLYLIGTIASVAVSLITFYNFTLKNAESSLFMEYGLFTAKKCRLVKKKICGVSVSEPLLMRAFGYVSVQVLIAGSIDSDESAEAQGNVIHPCLKKSELPQFLSIVLPDFQLDGEYQSVPKRGIRYFYYNLWHLLLVGAVVLFCLDYKLIGGIVLFLYVLALIERFFLYRHTKAFEKGNTVALSQGGFDIDTYYLYKDRIEYVTAKGSVWKEKNSLDSMKVFCYNGTEVVLKNLDRATIANIVGSLVK